MSSSQQIAEPLAFFRSLPPSRTNDASNILGNIKNEDKQLNANIFAHFNGSGDAFGRNIGDRIRVLQIDVFKRDGSEMEAKIVCEIDVKEGASLLESICLGSDIEIIVELRYGKRMENYAWRLWCFPSRYVRISVSMEVPCTFDNMTFRFTAMSTIALGIATDEDRSGMSQAMNLVYHNAAHMYVSYVPIYGTTTLIAMHSTAGRPCEVSVQQLPPRDV